MRFRHRDGTVVHLGYCANVHPADDFDGVLGQLASVAEPVRRRLDAGVLGIGLWLAAEVAAGLAADAAAVRRLRAELDARGLEVVTLNGFPYTGFGDSAVKYRVYQPDWSDPRRADHTARLAAVLAELVPADVRRASISTLPLGWRQPWPGRRRAAARRQIDALGLRLAELAERTGVAVRVGFEPEPGCVVENIPQAVEHLSGLDPERFGVCIDAAHLAVAHEEPAAALAALRAAELPVVKLQASAALLAERPDDEATREALAAFAEPRYLHQTREARSPGLFGRAATGPNPTVTNSTTGPDMFGPSTTAAVLFGTDDLDAALDPAGPLPGREPWRVHFHLPLHAAPEPPLAGTHSVLVDTLAELFSGPTAATDHIEVETYTWQVLPADRRPRDTAELAAGIAAEMAWARHRLLAAGLEQP